MRISIIRATFMSMKFRYSWRKIKKKKKNRCRFLDSLLGNQVKTVSNKIFQFFANSQFFDWRNK